MRVAVPALLVLILSPGGGWDGLRAQASADSVPPPVIVGPLEGPGYTPALAVEPFTAPRDAEAAAAQVEAIVRQDLLRSGRFRMAESEPSRILGVDALDHEAWSATGAEYVLRGRLEAAETGFTLLLEVHDVVHGRVGPRRELPLPGPRAGGFRMAVHRASDAVAEELSGEPGIAATQIAFAMRRGGGTKDLWVVDSDGANLRRLRESELAILSPAWHPAGETLAYTWLPPDGDAAVMELDVGTGVERRVPRLGEGLPYAPEYLPGGERLALTLDVGSAASIVTWDARRSCCATTLTEGRAQDLSATFSPDGSWMAFTSYRRGAGSPLVYARRVAGGEAEIISPWLSGVSADFTAPDWSPTGGRVAYHGRMGRSSYQIFVTEFDEQVGRTRQLTTEGRNESPSWAPDGRHLVFFGQRPEGTGLFILDTATGGLRLLVSGADISTPSWSPRLGGR